MKFAIVIVLFGALLAASGGASAQTLPQPSLPKNCSAVSTPFIGTICTPNAAGKHPAMILLGGSEGGDSFARLAPLFASHGYVAASVAYFGIPGLPPTLVDIPVETVKHAIDALQARTDVDEAKIGIMGWSKGGEFSLLAASTYPQIKAVVADVPSPVAFMGLGKYDVATGCSWSIGGKTLPCIPPDGAAGARIGEEAQHHQPLVLAPFYDASLNADPQKVRAAFFPLQNIKGPVLCLSGDDDQMWNSREQCSMAIAYLQAHHHAYTDTAISYPNAGHTFIVATRGPQSAMITADAGPVTLAFGGTPEGDAAAATAAWQQIWAFLAKNLGP